jgi:hypothetical protein
MHIVAHLTWCQELLDAKVATNCIPGSNQAHKVLGTWRKSIMALEGAVAFHYPNSNECLASCWPEEDPVDTVVNV